MPRRRIRPPAWWNRNLYSFVRGMAAEGWVWEFMRRARLLQILGDVPVDCMNPNPNLDNLEPDYRNLYNSWSWYIERNRRPIFMPPAVRPSSGWPIGFRGQEFEYAIFDPRTVRQQSIKRQIIEVRVDLSQRDSVIKRDFATLLESMRARYPEPKRKNPRFSSWPDMHVLEVWDLHQFGVSWKDILLEFDRSRQRDEIFVEDLPPVRNAHNTARSYIDQGRWMELALHTDVQENVG